LLNHALIKLIISLLVKNLYWGCTAAGWCWGPTLCCFPTSRQEYPYPSVQINWLLQYRGNQLQHRRVHIWRTFSCPFEITNEVSDGRVSESCWYGITNSSCKCISLVISLWRNSLIFYIIFLFLKHKIRWVTFADMVVCLFLSGSDAAIRPLQIIILIGGAT
jgi:hypothetical protein